MARRNTTDPDDRRPLSEPQLTAIELLVAGRNLAAVAAEIDVAVRQSPPGTIRSGVPGYP